MTGRLAGAVLVAGEPVVGTEGEVRASWGRVRRIDGRIEGLA
ncbi:hypothetical protein [Pseudonocardia lacus]|nr:hypothetical protein [Pseudonocardia lacus]